MSVEKCIAVYFPLKSKAVCTVRSAKWVTGIAGIVLAGYNVLYFLAMEPQIENTSGFVKCVVASDYWKTYLFYYSLDSILYSFEPFTLMFITNFAIVLKFMKTKCNSNEINSTESTDQALVKAATRGTVMVVSVSATFLLLTVPGGVAYALRPLTHLDAFPEYRVFMNLTTYLNHNVNGFLYCIVVTRFRRELFKLFFPKGKIIDCF